MKTLVVYRSHYGSTRRYAQWLAQALDADAAEERQADARLVQNYECVIFGGGLYAGSIAGAARMAKLYGALQGKRLAMFTVGLSDPSDPENVKKIMQDAGPGLYAGNAGEYLLFPPARRDGLPEYEACTQGDDGNAEKNAAEKTGERAKYGRKRAAGRI